MNIHFWATVTLDTRWSRSCKPPLDAFFDPAFLTGDFKQRSKSARLLQSSVTEIYFDDKMIIIHHLL